MNRPWKNRLIVKFFLSYLAVLLLLLIVFYLYSGSVMRDFYIASLSEKMEEQARIAARLIPLRAEGGEPDPICRDLARDLRARLTVIAPDGKVLCDSEEASAQMENHGQRPEVIEALSQGAARSIRYSTTVGYDMLYQAVLDKERGRMVRVSVPLSPIEKAISSIRGAMLLGLLAASGLGLLLAYFFSRRLGLRIQRLAEFSHEVARGSFPKRPLRIDERDELSVLERNLAEMSRGLQEKIKGIVAEKEKVDSILRCMAEGVLVTDTQGRVVLMNDNARQMFHLPASETLHGASFLEVSRHPEMKRLMEEVLSCDCSKECLSKEISLDEGKWFRLNAVSLRDADEKALGYLLVFHEVTELRRLEKVRADFVANVSHELRTPLTAIRGYAETLLQNPPTDSREAGHFLGIIYRHSERLGRLIDDLLTLSDIESGKLQLHREEIAAGQLIERVLEIFREQARKKGVALSHSVKDALPPLFGDQDRLQQLLINLVDNAVKYTPAGGEVKVWSGLAPSSEDSGAPMVEIAVADTGCGIPKKDLPRLTERFYRVDKARSRELGGTGLGLAIVKHIVQAHEGRLAIESQIQRGTTVRVFLPAARPRRVLFLCTANSCRSQMAEAFARRLAPHDVKIYSAGTAPKAIHPLAIRAMEEVGIDMADQRSKGIEDVPLESVDLVVTLCGEAAESCPPTPKKAARLHWPLPDPATASGDEETVLKTFREVRDEILSRVEKLFAR